MAVATEKGWCWDCKKDQTIQAVIPCCAMNPYGLKGIEHGNDNSCDDDYCRKSDFEDVVYDGSRPLEDYDDYHYRCSVCDTLNVEQNGHGRPK